MMSFYRNWKLRHVRKRLSKKFNYRSLKDMRSLLKIVHDIPLRVLCTMKPEQRGFVKVTTNTTDLLKLRSAANVALLELTDYDNLEALFRNYVGNPKETRTLSSYLGSVSIRIEVLCAKIDDITRTLEIICDSIARSPDAGYLCRVHEPMFEDYVSLITAIVKKGVVVQNEL